MEREGALFENQLTSCLICPERDLRSAQTSSFETARQTAIAPTLPRHETRFTTVSLGCLSQVHSWMKLKLLLRLRRRQVESPFHLRPN